MKYLKKFNESTSDFENDVNYIMSELIHEYDFRKYDVPFIGYAGRGGNSDEVHYYTDYVSINEEFNDMLIACKKKCDKVNVTFEVFLEYANNDYPGDGKYDINMLPASLDKYLSIYDSRYREGRAVNAPKEVDYEFCLMFKPITIVNPNQYP